MHPQLLTLGGEAGRQRNAPGGGEKRTIGLRVNPRAMHLEIERNTYEDELTRVTSG